MGAAAGGDRIGQQASDGHRTYAARHRGDRTGHRDAAVKVDIPHQTGLAFAPLWRVQAVDAYVDDGRARFCLLYTSPSPRD